MSTNSNIQEIVRQIVIMPAPGDTPFIHLGSTMGDVQALAQRIKSLLAQHHYPSPVCLCTEDRCHTAAALLAALSGGSPLILPYAFSEQALTQTKNALAYQYLLVDNDPVVPVGTQPLRIARSPGSDTTPISQTPAPVPIDQDDIWVYLFTGGTTGQPQTWTKTVRNLLFEALHLAETFQITSRDIILATVPPHHIYGLLYAVLVPLVSGAQVVARTPAFPNEIIEALQQSQASMLVSIPAHYRALKNHTLSNHHLRIAFSSAGPLALEDDLAFHEMTGVAITEIYGSTETGGIAYRQRAKGQTGLKPFDCVQWKIEDERLGVKSDYLSSELTRDADGYFKTADRVTMDHHQSFHLLGRTDGIIKVAGKRVDLASVQQTLKQLPDVRDAYVFARAVKKGRENEILALVEGNAQAEKLHGQLQAKLEPYARPRHIIVVPKIPVSKVGKYDRVEIEKRFK